MRVIIAIEVAEPITTSPDSSTPACEFTRGGLNHFPDIQKALAERPETAYLFIHKPVNNVDHFMMGVSSYRTLNTMQLPMGKG